MKKLNYRKITLFFFLFFSIMPVYAKVIIEKSPNDKKTYEYVLLDNQLKVVVVSDPSAEKAAATLAVLAGSYDEPVDKPGLAHFLEHMIIMGSKKYPHPGNFNTYVSDHGGGRNAMTAQDRTTFFYHIHPDYFEESLMRFADHFVQPLFDIKYIKKEIQAVEAEFQMHEKDDSYRSYYVLKNMVNPEHPMHRFTSGNKESLWPENKINHNEQELRKSFMRFYSEFYSADKMALVLVGPQSTQVLANWAKKYFSAIPLIDKKILKTNQDSIQGSVQAFREGKETQKNIIIHPLKPFYSISMAFLIPNQKKNYQTQPLMYLEVLFSNQAEQGLIHQLKNKGWITGMSPDQSEISASEVLYSFNFGLTELGLLHRDEIIQACYEYIQTIKQSNFPEWLYEEIKKIDQLNFQNVSNISPSTLSNYLAKNLHDYPPEKILSYAYLDPKVDMPKETIQEILNRFVPEKMVVLSFLPGDKKNKIEPYYKVPYYVESFSDQQKKAWTHPEGVLTQPIALLKPNRFLPANLKMKHVPHYAQPKLIESKAYQHIWYQPDTEFNMPRIHTSLALHTPYIYENPKNLLLAKLAISLASQEIAKMSTELALAGADIRYNLLETGLEVAISGYSDLSPYERILEKSIDTLKNIKINEHNFAIEKEKLLKVYHSMEQASPIENYSQEISVLFLKRKMPTEMMVAYLNELQVKDLEQFQRLFFKQLELEMLISGNIKKYEAKNLARKTIKLLKKSIQEKSSFENQRSVKQTPVLILPNKKQVLFLKHQHKDNLVAMYVQMKDKKIDTLAKSCLTEYLMKTKFFDELRTESQLGYIVFSQNMIMKELPGLMFFIQSPSHENSLIYNKINKFFHQYNQVLLGIKPDAFEQAKKALAAEIAQKPKSLGEKTGRYWAEIANKTYRFNRAKELAEAVEKITQKELLSFYQEEVLNKKNKELTVFGSAKNKNSMQLKDKMLFKQNSHYAL